MGVPSWDPAAVVLLGSVGLQVSVIPVCKRIPAVFLAGPVGV
jgi:hypothetical protein